MEISPYLSAIQALRGQTPGEKYKSLHFIAIQIIQNENDKKAFLESGFTSHVQPALLPFLRIIVGNKLKIQEFVIEALKSDDVAIVEQALGAKWFFNAENEYIRVDYFLNKIIPFVSMRTRRRLIKTLAGCLANYPQRADDFFTSFVDLYGLKQALPFLVSCSEQLILETVFNHKILLSNKILRVLYLRYPQLVVRYLQLGNEKNKSNLEDRKIHKIDIEKYEKLLPMIFKHHTKDFFEICESCPWYSIDKIKIGSTRTNFVLRNSVNLVIQKAELAFEIMPPKIIRSKLTERQFGDMIGSLFPEGVNEFYLSNTIDLLRHYPQEIMLPLLREKFKLAYGTDESDESNIYLFKKMFDVLPLDLKESISRRLLELHRDTSELDEVLKYFPPREVIPIMKKRIAEKTGSQQIISCFETMITSCHNYDSKNDLLEVLRYYRDQYKNESSNVFFSLARELLNVELDKSCWQILMYFAQKFYDEGDLYDLTSSNYLYFGLYEQGLLFHVEECQKDPADEEISESLDKLIEIILNCYLEHDLKREHLMFHHCSAELKEDCLKKYLETIPRLYPENHEVWDKFMNKLTLVSYLVKSIDDYDFKELRWRSKKKYGSKTALNVRYYPWLTKFTIDLLKKGDSYPRERDRRKYSDLKKSFMRLDLQLYESFVDDETNFISNLDASVAMRFLKHDTTKISNKWKLYLNTCKEKLQDNKRSVIKFVNAIKWHQDLPIKFVKQCLLEIEDSGSTAVLALLLEGEAFGKIAQSHIPEDKKIDVTDDNAKIKYRFISNLINSMKRVNPPVSFQIMSCYCHDDFVPLACRTLSYAAFRIPVDKVIAFASQFVDKPDPVEKLAITLVCRVSSYVESNQFLIHLWYSKTNLSIRSMVAKIIWNLFKHSQNERNWQLMKNCINGLNNDDREFFKFFIDKIDDVDKHFVSEYVQELLRKIKELEDRRKSELFHWLVRKLVRTFEGKFVSDDVLLAMIKEQFFECDLQFTLSNYLRSNPNTFDEKLKTLMDILREKFNDYNKPHPNHSRSCPMNLLIHQFFLSMACYLLGAEKNDMNSKLVTASLDLVSEKLKLHEEPLVFIHLHLVKDYLESQTSVEFGVKCVNTAHRLVDNFGSELILNDIAEFIKKMLCKARYFHEVYNIEIVMAIIEGLSQADERLATLIGIKLLSYEKTGEYDERYDEFFKRWSGMKDPMVLAAMNDYRNRLQDYEELPSLHCQFDINLYIKLKYSN